MKRTLSKVLYKIIWTDQRDEATWILSNREFDGTLKAHCSKREKVQFLTFRIARVLK